MQLICFTCRLSQTYSVERAINVPSITPCRSKFFGRRPAKTFDNRDDSGKPRAKGREDHERMPRSIIYYRTDMFQNISV